MYRLMFLRKTDTWIRYCFHCLCRAHTG